MQQFTASEAHKLALSALSDEYDKVVSMIKKEAEKVLKVNENKIVDYYFDKINIL